MSGKYKVALYLAGTIIFLIGALTLFIQYQNKESQTILDMTTEQKLSDFDTLCSVLDESYPFWSEVQQADIDKNEVYNTYRANIANTKTDIEFFKEIRYFLKEFGGFGHLSVLDGYMYRLYIDTLSASSDILSEQEEQSVQSLVAVLTDPVSQNTYSALDQSHEGFRSTTGLKDAYKNQSLITDKGEPSQLTARFYNDAKVAYIKIDSFNLVNYQEDKTFLTEFYREAKDIPNLIIDLRENRGGSDLYWQDLIVKPNVKESVTSDRYYFFNVSGTNQDYILANRIHSEPVGTAPEPYLSQYNNLFSHYTVDRTSFERAANPYKGNVWVLVNDEVYSACENFVMFCKNTGFATLIGTTTGGDGGIADPMLVSLPNSGLIVRFSVFYGINADGSGNEANGTTPDILIPDGEDALEKCLELID